MSDPKQISVRELLAFIKRKSSASSSGCIVCSGSDWILQDLHGIPVADKNGSVQLENLAGYTVLTCSSCGHARFFSLKTILPQIFGG